MTHLTIDNREVVPNRDYELHGTWKQFTPPPHEFLAVACREEEGGFSVFAMRHPGIVSQGETIEEAKANIADAFSAMLEACNKLGEPLPFSDTPVVDLTGDCQQFWVTVDG
jgi:predicted RNase H-like HicB family nuclease